MFFSEGVKIHETAEFVDTHFLTGTNLPHGVPFDLLHPDACPMNLACIRILNIDIAID
ncbi:MAG: hypothetical protein ABJN40_19550 [Sneathiella sp.]